MASKDQTELLRDLLSQRILVIDGAMGSLIQQYELTEADFRGEPFRDHTKDLEGDNDMLVWTRLMVGRIDRLQAEDYATRQGVSIDVVERWLSPNLGYDPTSSLSRC